MRKFAKIAGLEVQHVFGDYELNITVPADFIVGATGSLQNPKEVLTKKELLMKTCNGKLEKATKITNYLFHLEPLPNLLEVCLVLIFSCCMP